MKCPNCQTENPELQKYCGECATPLTADGDALIPLKKILETPLDSLTRGTLFANRHEIIEELGRGRQKDDRAIPKRTDYGPKDRSLLDLFLTKS